MLDLVHLTKVYKGGKRGLDDLTLRLEPGILGLLGPNGAGKSSLMRIAATVTRPTAGSVRFHGTDVVARPNALRRQLGYLPQDFGVYPHLTSREFLGYLAAAKGVSARTARARIDELLELVNLTEAVKRPLGKYSGGMLRRIGIAQVLLTDPQVIIVDEPTAGLDPEERVGFRHLLSELAADKAVLLSTHIASDVASVASRIAVLADGRLRSHGAPEELLRAVDGQVWEVLVAPSAVPAVQERYIVSRMVRTADGVRIRLLSPQLPYEGALPRTADLEDAYLAVIRRAADAPAAQAAGERPRPARAV
ncbi:ABC transporter ATP-binding protein [Streptomyces sioyaensis]|uniref:ABC transporter ATP-binding protein n=1 Tax=Streptomyces sioyaensis TaxID=67364 RepID=UPI00378E1E80